MVYPLLLLQPRQTADLMVYLLLLLQPRQTAGLMVYLLLLLQPRQTAGLMVYLLLLTNDQFLISPKHHSDLIIIDEDAKGAIPKALLLENDLKTEGLFLEKSLVQKSLFLLD